MLLKTNSTADRYVRGLGVFDVDNTSGDDNSLSLCIPLKKVECKKVNQYIEGACELFRDKYPMSNHSYPETSLTVDYDGVKTSVNLLVAVIDDILEEMEIYGIPLNNGDILNRQTKNLFKEMLLKELDKVLSF